METTQTMRRSLDQGMWVFSMDLKDAYFHISIHPSSRKFLGICMEKEVFQFKAFPFGISSAPWLFTKIFKQLAVIFRRKYIAIHQYLDDWLNKQWSREKSLQDRQKKPLPVPTNGLSHQLGQIRIEPHSTAELHKSSLRPPRGHRLTCNRKNGKALQRVSNPPTQLSVQDQFRCLHGGDGVPIWTDAKLMGHGSSRNSHFT